MTTQRDALNRFLAERVMGYEFDILLRNARWFNSQRNIWLYGTSFNPTEQWDDCEPLLDKIEQDKWDIWAEWDHRTHIWSWTLVRVDENRDEGPFSGNSQSRTEALCLAIARAYGWREDGHGRV